jgi:hypothetical protein
MHRLQRRRLGLSTRARLIHNNPGLELYGSFVLTVTVLGLEHAHSFQTRHRGPVSLFMLLISVVCSVVFIHAACKMPGIARASASSRRISVYILASIRALFAWPPN